MVSSESRRLVALLGVFPLRASGSDSVHAQDVARDSLAGARDAVLRSLEAGQRLRVELTRGTRRAGRYVGYSEDQVTIGHTEGARDFSYHSVDRLEMFWTEGNSADRGALIGTGSGLVVGGLLGAYVGKLASSEASDDHTLEGAHLIGGLGAAGAPGLGAVVDLLIPRWVQRWP